MGDLSKGWPTAGKIRLSSLQAPVKIKPGSVRAFFFRDAAPVEMSPTTSTDLPTGRKSHALADLPLVLTEPCAVTTGGLTFRVEQEGLYRFGNLTTKETANVILYRDDLWRFVGHLSRLQVHGWRQDGESIPRWTERARKGRLSISCGNIVRFVAHHLAERGHKSRVVNLVTLEEHNHYDDGHVLMEVFDPREKRWILYDPDMKCRFRHAGRALNLGEAVALYRKGGSAELEFFCAPAIDAYAEEKASAESAQYSLLFEWAFRDATARQAWYRRMMQVPLLNGSAGAWREADVARIKATGYGKPVAWDEWMKAAYGKTSSTRRGSR